MHGDARYRRNVILANSFALTAVPGRLSLVAVQFPVSTLLGQWRFPWEQTVYMGTA